MKWIAIALLAPGLPLAAQGDVRPDRLVADGNTRPPVLRSAEPSDSTVITLPGAPVREPSPQPAPAPPPVSASVTREKPVTIPDADHRPVLRRAPKPILPAEFERDTAAFCQKLIGGWTEPDAYNLFGDPLRQRPAIGDDGAENGRILAYSDPTGRYREIELDFAKDTGTLRTVFVYPWKMTWEQCRRQWGANVQITAANKGRKFYSYLDRHLDVLVDTTGNVISLGLY